MNIIAKAVTGMTGILAFGALFAGSASACPPVAGLKPAAYFGSGSGRSPFVLVADRRDDLNPVVGLWTITFVSKGSQGIPDGTVIDSGFQTWHDDGTEILNSGARPPVTGNFCTGIWTQTGSYTYVLNHFALSWDSTGATFLGPANIKESVTLDYSGTAFSGTFTIMQYDTKGNVTQTVTGTVTGQKMTVDSN